jgi:GNAT superfamily N-acetyltransferase
MTIRRATLDDFEEIFALIEQMVIESSFSFAPPSRARIKALMEYKKGAAFLAYKEDKCIGFVGAIIAPFFFSDYERATDVGFYILPEHRGGSAAFKLLRTIEDWAKENGAKEIFMGHSVGGKIEEMKSFYVHNGYKIGGFNSMKRF